MIFDFSQKIILGLPSLSTVSISYTEDFPIYLLHKIIKVTSISISLLGWLVGVGS